MKITNNQKRESIQRLHRLAASIRPTPPNYVTASELAKTVKVFLDSFSELDISAHLARRQLERACEKIIGYQAKKNRVS